MEISELFCFKSKRIAVTLILYNKIKELQRNDSERMFQYEKTSLIKEGGESVFIQQTVFFHFSP